MALEITYYGNSDTATRLAYGIELARLTVTLTGTSADLGAVPSGAAFARLRAGEACVVTNSGNAASATQGQYLATGDVIDMQVPKSGQFKGMTG